MPVYDLTVDEQHVFYANGVLVHNCAESAQYACLHYNMPAMPVRKTRSRAPVRPGYVYAGV